MREKKIHIALRDLSVYELNSFQKYLSSPFFNQNEAITAYFHLMNDLLRNDKALDTYSDEEIWMKLYGSEAFNSDRFRKLNSDFGKLFEAFLAQKEYEKDVSLQNSLKIKAFKQRGLSSLYKNLINHINKAKRIQQTKSAEYYLNVFNIEKNIFSLQSDVERKSKTKDPVKDLNIEEISLNLDVFYIAEKLKYYCTTLSWSRSYKIDKKIAGIDFILRLAKTELFRDYPPIKVYYTISQTIKEEDNVEHYFKLKELIDKYIHLFPEEEAREIVDAAISYCVVKNNRGNQDFLNEVLYMYKKALSEELIFDNGYLSTTSYRNIALYGMRANDLKWAEEFILNYKNKLREEFAENATNFSLARLEYFRNDYNKIIDYLNLVGMNDTFYNLNVRTLYIVAYYELSEFGPLESLLQSFAVWLNREKSLSRSKKLEYQNLIRYMRKIISLPIKDKARAEKLKNELSATPGVVNKAWLLQKLDEIIDPLGKRRSVN